MLTEYLNIDKIKARVKEITLEHVAKPTSDKARKIGVLIKQMGNNNSFSRKLADVLSLIIDERIPVPPNACGTSYPVGMMLVFTGKGSRGHNYDLNEPILVDMHESRNGLKMNGTIGNNFPGKEHIRKATSEEIDEFFDCFNYSCGRENMESFLRSLS